MKTSHDLISSRRGAAFRRLSCDGRSWCARAIHTLGSLRRPTAGVASYLVADLTRPGRFTSGR